MLAKNFKLITLVAFLLCLGMCKAKAGTREPLPENPQLPASVFSGNSAPPQQKTPETKRSKPCDTCMSYRGEPRKDISPKPRRLPEDQDPKKRYPLL